MKLNVVILIDRETNKEVILVVARSNIFRTRRDLKFSKTLEARWIEIVS